MLNPVKRAAAALNRDRPAEAIDILVGAMEGRQPAADALRIFVRACRKLGRMAFAVDYLGSVQRRYPGDADVVAELAHSHLLGGDIARAAREIRRGLGDHPGHPGLNLLSVNLKRRQCDDETAREILAAMCRPGRQEPGDLRDFGRQLTEFGLYEQAAGIWLRLLEQNAEAYLERIGLAYCQLKLGHAEEAASLAESAARHSGGQARHLALADAIAAAASPDVERRMAGLRRDLFAAAPPPHVRQILDRAAQRLQAIRAEPASLALLRDQGRKASLVCPIHRRRDLANAVLQVRQQDWGNAEAIFAVNGSEIEDAQLAGLWRSPRPLKIVDCRNLATIGAVLNRALTEASGDYILKIDADDRYFPAYCRDMIVQAEYFAADLVEKPGKFLCIEQSQAIVLESFADIYAVSRRGPSAGGSTLCIRRDLCNDIRFNEEVRVSEDVLFQAACAAQGARLVLADPFNYLAIRSADTANHTWRIDPVLLAMLRETVLIGGIDATAAIAA